MRRFESSRPSQGRAIGYETSGAASLSYPSPLWGGWLAQILIWASRVGVSPQRGLARRPPPRPPLPDDAAHRPPLGRPSPQGGGIALHHHSNRKRPEKGASISHCAR